MATGPNRDEKIFFPSLALDDRNQQQRSWADTPPVAPPETLARTVPSTADNRWWS